MPPLEPAVCVVICTRNRADRLSGTLESLTRLETCHAWEAIIVDNASTDRTAEVIAKYTIDNPRIHYMRVGRIGLGAARDAAWRATSAEIVCFTDDDCYVASDFIDAILKAFEGWPQVGAIGGRILLHDPADARVTIDEREEPALYPTHTVLEAGQIQGANVSFRRRALEESGGFDPDLGAGTPFPAEDVDAVAAVMWAGFDVRYDPRPTVSHHHGRKDADIPVLMANYDAGRGAYWAKFILRPDTRVAYLRKWWSAARDQPETETLGRLNRELKSAFRYAALKRRYGSIAIAVPAAAAVIAFFALRSAAHAARPSLRSCRGSSHLL